MQIYTGQMRSQNLQKRIDIALGAYALEAPGSGRKVGLVLVDDFQDQEPGVSLSHPVLGLFNIYCAVCKIVWSLASASGLTLPLSQLFPPGSKTSQANLHQPGQSVGVQCEQRCLDRLAYVTT